jgi:signal transduction histidine kinase
MVKDVIDLRYVSLHEQVLEAIPDGVTVQDRDFNIIFQNKAMKQAFGDWIGKKCYAAYEKREQTCEDCGLVTAFETGSPVMVHRSGVMQDGMVGHWENACFPLFDSKGNIVAGVEVCRNVTDRVSLAQEVRDRNIELGKLNDQLKRQKSVLEERTQELAAAYDKLKQTHTQMLQREKMASIGQLAAGIAHEINTPVQFVGDNLSFLRESFDEILDGINQYHEMKVSAEQNNEELSKLRNQIISLFENLDFEYLKKEIPLALDQTADGVRHVAEIVQAMKNFAHFSNTAQGPVKIDDLIQSTVEITRNAWKYVADLTVELAEPPLVVKGAWGELGQVLLNLILNAVDAIADAQYPENERGRILIQCRRTDKWGEVVVKDSGCGIEPSLQRRIFEPFFTTKDVGHGTGQGLAMAYNIVTEAHGGELIVESEPGEGSSFIIRLPLYEGWG